MSHVRRKLLPVATMVGGALIAALCAGCGGRGSPFVPNPQPISVSLSTSNVVVPQDGTPVHVQIMIRSTSETALVGLCRASRRRRCQVCGIRHEPIRPADIYGGEESRRGHLYADHQREFRRSVGNDYFHDGCARGIKATSPARRRTSAARRSRRRTR